VHHRINKQRENWTGYKQFNNHLAMFASLKKQTEILFLLICHERKILLRLKKQAEKYGL